MYIVTETIPGETLIIESESYRRDVRLDKSYPEENQFVYSASSRSLTHYFPGGSRVFENAWLSISDRGNYSIHFDITSEGLSWLSIDRNNKTCVFGEETSTLLDNNKLLSEAKVFVVNTLKELE